MSLILVMKTFIIILYMNEYYCILKQLYLFKTCGFMIRFDI